MNYVCMIPSPVGRLTVASDGLNVTGLWLEGQKYYAATLEESTVEQEIPVFYDVKHWLDTYFKGKQPDFSVPLAPAGSDFRKSVWKILCDIPYGKVTTYGSIAKQLEKESNGKQVSARAVGGAVGHNPISILIPCHRVVGSNNSLTGYAGGIDKKVQLLKLERAPIELLHFPAKES